MGSRKLQWGVRQKYDTSTIQVQYKYDTSTIEIHRSTIQVRLMYDMYHNTPRMSSLHLRCNTLSFPRSGPCGCCSIAGTPDACN